MIMRENSDTFRPEIGVWSIRRGKKECQSTEELISNEIEEFLELERWFREYFGIQNPK